MIDNLEDNRTEGPEGYFVRSTARPAAETERRERGAGRRAVDAELQRARKRLTWAYAVFGAVVAVGLVMVVTAWLE